MGKGGTVAEANARKHRIERVAAERGATAWPSARRTLATVAGVATAILCACTSEQTRKEAELTQIEQWLPGRYDNHAQLEEARAAGHAAPPSLTLIIEPADALLLGRHVFFAEEAADQGERHSIGQRLISFEVIEAKIIATVWVLNDPRRWREASENPELFTSLQPPDVRQVRGCNLTWKKEAEKFTGATDQLKCRTPSFGPGSASFVETHMELTSDDLSIDDRHVDGHGTLLDASGAPTLIQFRHTGG